MLDIIKKNGIILLLAGMLSMSGCSKVNSGTYIVKTYDTAGSDLPEENTDIGKEQNLIRYYELSDGKWCTDNYTYDHRLVLTGRLPSAVKDSTFVVLSNRNDITFEMAAAELFSSDLNAQFNEEETVLIAMY